MFICFGKVPVSIYQRGIRIVSSKKTVRHTADPDILLVWRPGLDSFRTSNNCSQMFCAPVTDPGFLCSCIDRIHILPVNARRNQNFITRSCDLCRIVDAAERSFLCTVSVTANFAIYINFHMKTSLEFVLMLLFFSFLTPVKIFFMTKMPSGDYFPKEFLTSYFK